MEVRKTLIALVCMGIGIGTIAVAQNYFADDFEDSQASAAKWVDLFGQWEFTDGEYIQNEQVPNCMSVVADEYWDESWSDYTFEVNANRIDGAEGFLIMFRSRGLMQARGQALRDHPQRMESLDPPLQYWWNVGGWGNTRSQVESWGGVAGADSTDTIESDQWYNIKIVNTPTDYTILLDDQEVAKVEDDTQDGMGRPGLATWSTAARFDDVKVYGPAGPTSVEPTGKAATTWGHIKSKVK